jgi:hypothetical protein
VILIGVGEGYKVTQFISNFCTSQAAIKILPENVSRPCMTIIMEEKETTPTEYTVPCRINNNQELKRN